MRKALTAARRQRRNIFNICFCFFFVAFAKTKDQSWLITYLLLCFMDAFRFYNWGIVYDIE